jgi:dynein light chain 1, axonemal
MLLIELLLYLSVIFYRFSLSYILVLENLEILSLSRNLIKRIMGLEEIGGTLKELWLSYNLIEKLDGFQPCTKLEVLYLGNNKIKSWDEVSKLVMLSRI